MAAAAVLTPLVRPAKAPDDVRDCSKRNRYEEDDGEEPLHDLDGASANKPPCLALRAPILLLPFMFILLLKGRCGTSTSWMVHIVGGEIGRTNGMRTSVSWARWIYAASVSSSNKSLCVPSGAKRGSCTCIRQGSGSGSAAAQWVSTGSGRANSHKIESESSRTTYYLHVLGSISAHKQTHTKSHD